MFFDKVKINNTYYDVVDKRVDSLTSRVDDLDLKRRTGNTALIRELMTSFYPYPTSAGADVNVVPSTADAYYVQGFCCTPNGFALVRLAPESNKNNENDISQIFEFGYDGTYLRGVAVDVHHGNGMCYYDGYIYCDVGSNVAKIKYDTLTIESYIELGGSCPAIDRENKVIYSVDSGSKRLYKYDITSQVVSYISIDSNAEKAYNAGMYKDGIFYALTYTDDLIMIDVNTGEFLGGIYIPEEDVYHIRLLEMEDLDTDEDGNCYVLVNQMHYTTDIFNTSGTKYRLRKAGFYIGQLFLDGGGSSYVSISDVPSRVHATGVVVKNDSSESDEMNAKLELGTSNYPFRNLASASYFNVGVRNLNCSGYTKIYGGDIYQPFVPEAYAIISNLVISTDSPLAIKNWRGYLYSERITITDWGISLVYCDIDNCNITGTKDGYIGLLQRGRAEILPATDTYKLKMKTAQCILNGSNIIPDGSCITEHMGYGCYSFTQGSNVSIYLPNIGGSRRTRLALSNSDKYVIYTRYSGSKLIGSDGSTLSLTSSYDADTGLIEFIAPFDIRYIEVF